MFLSRPRIYPRAATACRLPATDMIMNVITRSHTNAEGACEVRVNSPLMPETVLKHACFIAYNATQFCHSSRHEKDVI